MNSPSTITNMVCVPPLPHDQPMTPSIKVYMMWSHLLLVLLFHLGIVFKICAKTYCKNFFLLNRWQKICYKYALVSFALECTQT